MTEMASHLSSEFLRTELEKRILVLDGAMGTMLQSMELTEAQVRGPRFRDHHIALLRNYGILSLTNPELIRGIHLLYLDAGADIIKTNTFHSSSVAQSAFDITTDVVYDMNLVSAQIARAEADRWIRRNPSKFRFVAGSVGPTAHLLSWNQHRSQEFFDSFKYQVLALVRGGCDIILIETVVDLVTLHCQLLAIDELFSTLRVKLPIMVSASVDEQGQLRSGHSLNDICNRLASEENVVSFGVNCSFGVRLLVDSIEKLAVDSRVKYVSCHPNAGLPVLDTYDDSPEFVASILTSLAKDKLLSMVGGCCGTTPALTRQLVSGLEGLPPRKRPLPMNELQSRT